MIEKHESIILTCKELISQGKKRDDIDFYLKNNGYDAKDIAAINYELQYIYVEREINKQRKEKGWSYIIAGIIFMLIVIAFTLYTGINGEYLSFVISLFLLYFTNKFIKKGKAILNPPPNQNKSKFDSSFPHTPKRGT